MSLENWLILLKYKTENQIADILDGNLTEDLEKLYNDVEEYKGTWIDYECINIERLQQIIIMAINNDYSGLDF